MKKNLIKKELKSIEFEFNLETQQLVIKTFNTVIDPNTQEGFKEYTGEITVNKTYMFSIFIFISQIMRRRFITKSVAKKLKKLKELKNKK